MNPRTAENFRRAQAETSQQVDRALRTKTVPLLAYCSLGLSFSVKRHLLGCCRLRQIIATIILNPTASVVHVCIPYPSDPSSGVCYNPFPSG